MGFAASLHHTVHHTALEDTPSGAVLADDVSSQWDFITGTVSRVGGGTTGGETQRGQEEGGGLLAIKTPPLADSLKGGGGGGMGEGEVTLLGGGCWVFIMHRGSQKVGVIHRTRATAQHCRVPLPTACLAD